eukprot:SAG25_NODE_1302_length_3354_cov_27.875576_5_plen_318_part_00
MNALEFSEFSSDEEEHHEGDLLLGEGTAGATGGPPPKKPVSVFGLVVISFFWVCGGIYGAEEILASAPPAYVFGSMVLTPVFFGLPAALMNAELSTAYPVTGGYVVWVEAALGRTVGMHNSIWRCLTCVLDAALYPQLVVQYAARVIDLSRATQTTLGMGLVVAIMLLNLNGVEAMMQLETVLAVISLAPTVAFVAMGFSQLSIGVLTSTIEPCCAGVGICSDPASLLPNCTALAAGGAAALLEVEHLYSAANASDAAMCALSLESIGGGGLGSVYGLPIQVGRVLPECPAFEPACTDVMVGPAGAGDASLEVQLCA